jgi:hypothetical protein
LVCIDFASAQIYHALKIMPLSHPDTEATIVPLVSSLVCLRARRRAASPGAGEGGRNVARRRSKGEKLPSDLEARQCHTVFCDDRERAFLQAAAFGHLENRVSARIAERASIAVASRTGQFVHFRVVTLL